MDFVFVGLVFLMVSVFLLAFYMDWLGLWVAKPPVKVPLVSEKEKTQGQVAPRCGADSF